MSNKNKDLHSLHIKFSDKELADIDGWGEENEVRTRSAAVRQLIRLGLKQSQSEGMSETTPTGFTAPSQRFHSTSNEDLRQVIQEEIQKALVSKPSGDSR